jgi:uncharacterized membrane protein YfcA
MRRSMELLARVSGTVINVAAIAAGTTVGVLAGARLPERLGRTLMQVLGLVTLAVGLEMAFGLGALRAGPLPGPARSPASCSASRSASPPSASWRAAGSAAAAASPRGSSPPRCSSASGRWRSWARSRTASRSTRARWC